MKKPELTIEIVSDVVCPWCYIGRKRMERAVDELDEQFSFVLSSTAFELNPSLPAEGTDQREFLTRKFGGEERYEQITGRVAGIAADEGLSFDFAHQKVLPNTRDAHRIIWLAGQHKIQGEASIAFHKAYFEDAVDLSNPDNLVEVAASAGLDRPKVKALLESDEGLAEVMMQEELNRQRGITGVPFFLINNKYGISGAQPAETLKKALEEIAGKQSIAEPR